MIATSAAVSAPHQRRALPRSRGCEPGSRRRGHEQHAGEDRDCGDGNVDEEDRTPPEPCEQQATGNRPGRGRDPGDTRPDRDRLSALTLVEHVAEDRERGGHRARAAHAHHAARDRQHERRGRERGRARRGPEHREPDEQEALAAVAVAEHRERQEQPGEHEPVRRRDPLQVGLVGVQLATEARDRDREDGVVDHDHAQREAQHDEREPPPRMPRRRALHHRRRLGTPRRTGVSPSSTSPRRVASAPLPRPMSLPMSARDARLSRDRPPPSRTVPDDSPLVLLNPARRHEPAAARTRGPAGAPVAFHRRLPGYAPTRVVDAPGLAADIGVASVVIKDEAGRLGMPSFKILGASWAVYRLLVGPARPRARVARPR